jgi:hypothetical protein
MQQATAAARRGEMAVLDHTGDTKITWDADSKDEVDAARATFDKLKKKGYLAYRVVGRDETKGEVIREFDPDAERIILSPPMVGG